MTSHANFGTIGLNLESAPPPRSLIVTGVARSGTSAVAGALAEFGVPMGPTDYPALHEDREFQALITSARTVDDMVTLVAERNADNRLWGLKFPSIGLHVGSGELARVFPECRVVVVTRDVTASAVRIETSDIDMQGKHADAAATSLRLLRMTMDWVLELRVPVLLVSYEKLITMPGAVLPELARFAGLVPDAETMARAVAAILPNNPAYISTFHQPVTA